MMRVWLVIAALNGTLAVGLGAYAAHGLKVSAERMDAFETAVRYQMWHALALLAVAWMAARTAEMAETGGLMVTAAGILFTLGILFFCGSLYGIGLTGSAPVPRLAPIGGVMLMLGWLAIALHAVLGR